MHHPDTEQETKNSLLSSHHVEERDQRDREGHPLLVSLSPVSQSTSIKKRRVVVIVDPLLREMEDSVCRPDLTHKKVCCLSGGQIRDITRKLTCLAWIFGYYLLLLFSCKWS